MDGYNITPSSGAQGERLADELDYGFSGMNGYDIIQSGGGAQGDRLADELDYGFSGDISNSNLLDDGFHNALGKGKVKKVLRAAGKSITTETKAAVKNVGDTTKAAAKSIASETKKAGKNIVATTKKDFKKLEGGGLMHDINVANPVMVAMRGAVIGMLESNFIGLATAFAGMKNAGTSHWDKILQKWWLAGGDKNKLNNNVENHKNKKPFLKNEIAKVLHKKLNFDGSYSNADANPDPNSGHKQDIGNTVAATAGLAAVAGGIVTAINPPAGLWVDAGAGFLGVATPIMKDFSIGHGASTELVDQIPPPDTTAPPFPPEPTEKQVADALAAEEDKIAGMPSMVFYGLLTVGLILGGAIIYKKYIKK